MLTLGALFVAALDRVDAALAHVLVAELLQEGGAGCDLLPWVGALLLLEGLPRAARVGEVLLSSTSTSASASSSPSAASVGVAALLSGGAVAVEVVRAAAGPAVTNRCPVVLLLDWIP